MTTKHFLLVVLLAVVVTVVGYTERGDATLALAAQQRVPPKQSHYAVYFYVCSSLVSVFVVGGNEKPHFATSEHAATEEMLALLVKAETAGQSYDVRHWRQSCSDDSPTLSPPTPDSSKIWTS